jgi:4-amino-4-deoxy-L-arabinose transferase-like glycosyltransferase/tetratricopeptide (TPR) repeat protein
MDKSAFFLGAVLILAFFLRFSHLGSRPLYQDEPHNTVELAAGPLSYIVSTNSGSILYPLLLHFILPLGNTEFMARLPAALFGFLSIWLIYLIGKILFGKKEALLAALLSALSGHFIYFSQQARGYSGLLLFTLCSLYFFMIALKNDKRYVWGFYAFFTVVAVYMSFFALVIIPVQVLFLVVLLTEQRLFGKKDEESSLSNKKILDFSLSLVSILVVAFLLYLPARHTSAYVNLSYMLRLSVEGLFKGDWTFSPFSFIADTFKRLLDYDVYPALVFIKLGLAFTGIVAAMINKRRELIFLLAWIVLPFALFILSKPPVIYLPADNKFIFTLPVLFLLLANGVTCLSSALGRRFSNVFRVKNEARFGTAVLAAFISLILVGESVHVRYGLLARRLTSLDRDREISTALKSQVQDEEMVFADSPAAQLNFLFVKPLVYPDGSKKGVMVFERFHDASQATLVSPAGLWILLNKSRLDESAISKWKKSSPGIRIESYSNGRLLHLPSPEAALWEKLDLAINLLLELPSQKEHETAYRLFLAKIFLMAGKNQQAMGQLEAMGRTTEAPLLLKAKREQEVLQRNLCENIVTMLLDNADRAWLEGKGDEALFLQKKAEDLSLETAELRSRVYFSQAESYLRIGKKAEGLRKYQQALTVCRTRKDEDVLIKKIEDLSSLPFGYLIWRQEGFCRVRWWSDQRRIFSGEITGSSISKKIKKLRWTKDDFASFSGNKLIFKGVSDKGRTKGFDLRTGTGSSPTFLFTIDGAKNILDKIILAERAKSPERMPFSLD